MNRTKLLLIGCSVLVVLAGFFWWSGLNNVRRAAEAEARARAAQQEAARVDEPGATGTVIPEDELARLRADRAELLRLRGEVAQLRRQLAEAANTARRVPGVPSPSVAPTPPGPAQLVENFVANVRAAVPWQQTLVTGGWATQAGKRAFFLIEPRPAGENESPGQLTLQTRIVEVPEHALAQLGLTGLVTDHKESSSQSILTREQAETLLNSLSQTAGVDLLAAPVVTTLDGRQAQVKVADVRTAPSGETYETGPMVDVVPRISADRASVDLTVTAQLRFPTHRTP